MKRLVLITGSLSFALLAGSAQQVIEKASSRSAVSLDPYHPPGPPEPIRSEFMMPGSQSQEAWSIPTVWIEELRHKVPKRASREYKNGRRAYQKGDYEAAIDHFQNTIQLDPDFAGGHNDLGVALEKIGDQGEAAEEFQRAAMLAPHSSQPLSNLCLSLYALRRYRETISPARLALSKDPGLLNVRYLLAVSLFLGDGNKQEALSNLEQIAPFLPKARLIASGILIEMNRRSEAARELAEYLRSVPHSDPSWHQLEVELAALQR